ncbi:MAG: phosphoadenosine phosphosulfate reductase, partial [Thermosynechococcaceae cyanobacterium]
ELHHHLVDGREGSTLFDWPVTEDYCRTFAQAIGCPIYFSWLEGGLEREMCREYQAKAPTHFETPGGVQTIGGSGQRSTRRKFPAKTADLSRRWCSAYAKIDVLNAAIANQPRFNHSRSLVVTGERAAESAARSQYKRFEPHRTDRRHSPKRSRHVDHWRAVHLLSERQVWAMIERWKIQVHPAYSLGWGRLSCQRCIFGSPHQWASNWAIAPQETQRMVAYEQAFGHTLDNKRSIPEMVAQGTVYETALRQADNVKLALSRE